MLFLIAAWGALLAAAVPTGAAVLRWTTGGPLDPSAAGFDRRGDRLILSAWLGLLVLGSALLAVSLVVALTPAVGALVGVGAATAALSSRPVREEISSLRARLSGRLALASLALAAGVGIATAQPVLWRDTGLYHTGAIRWLSEHGAVEGVAHVHEGLGNGSSWFALAAPLNPDGLRDHAMAVMGGLALLLLVFHALICVSRALRRDARPADWLLIAGSALLIPTIVALQKVHVSASPDLPIMVLGLLVGWAILILAGVPRGRRISAPRRLSPGPAAIPLLLALGAMAVKPHAAPLVAVAAAFYLWTGEPRLGRAAWVAVLGVLLVAPWTGFQFVATGCPAYSLPICADVPWSVGAESAREAAERLHVGARRGDPSQDSGLGWVGPWLTDDLSPGLGALAAASVLMLVGALIAGAKAAPASRRRRRARWVALAGGLGLLGSFLRADEIFMVALAGASLVWLGGRRWPGTGWLLALGLVGVALTLYGAPHPRFAFGYMALLLGRLTLVHGPGTWARLRPHLGAPARLPRIGLANLLLAGAAVVVLGTLARPTATVSEAFEPRTFAIPPPMTASVTIHPAFPLYRVADDGNCWAAELPCVPGYGGVDPDVGLRAPDQGIGGGFTRSAGDG